MSQLMDRLARLPRSQRLALYALSYLLIAVVLFFTVIGPTFDAISTATSQRDALTTQRDQVRARAQNRAGFEADLEELAADLKQALKELPDDREIPGLLSEIDAVARKSGLDVRKFQPLPEVMHEYYADVPVQIVMEGGFHEVAIFFDRVGKMNRIVSAQDIELKEPIEGTSEVNLTVEGRVVTYRFLTEDEQKKQKDTKKRGEPAGGGEE